MGKPAARISDMHMCPMVTPGLPPIPHVGGPVTGPGCPTVLIGGMPAAVQGDMCVCVGPPDIIAMGSTGVMIGGKPAARMGDTTAHGGAIILGCMTVLIGETSSGGGANSSNPSNNESGKDINGKMGAIQAKDMENRATLTQAAKDGEDNAKKTSEQQYTAQFTLVDDTKNGIKNIKYEITTPDNKKISGVTDGTGKTQTISGYTTSECTISYFFDK